ncbi:FAD-dependent oxidoreductase OS=Streptomyces microflavus OX=1919 GN=G3I39_14570 PE=4 SV=1 [Streptomyces microflavus]
MQLGDNTLIHYDKLLLATGSEPRRLDVPGTDLVGVHHLRRLAHADRLRNVLAALGRDNGAPGDRRRRLDRPGGRRRRPGIRGRGHRRRVGGHPAAPGRRPRTGPDLHRTAQLHGVRFHFGARLTEIVGQDGMVLAARTDDGEEHPAHDVLAAIGAAPRSALAEAAGLEMAERAHGGGIAVDASLRTSDPHIYAAGDVAAVAHPLLGVRLRVERWANALNSGPAAARAMLGQDVTYDRVPYFFSDQYDLGLECSGWAPPGTYDEVIIRGDAGKREFIAFWLKDRRVLAGMNVNVWDVTETIQELIRAGQQHDPEALADPSVPLDSLL